MTRLLAALACAAAVLAGCSGNGDQRTDPRVVLTSDVGRALIAWAFDRFEEALAGTKIPIDSKDVFGVILITGAETRALADRRIRLKIRAEGRFEHRLVGHLKVAARATTFLESHPYEHKGWIVIPFTVRLTRFWADIDHSSSIVNLLINIFGAQGAAREALEKALARGFTVALSPQGRQVFELGTPKPEDLVRAGRDRDRALYTYKRTLQVPFMGLEAVGPIPGGAGKLLKVSFKASAPVDVYLLDETELAALRARPAGSPPCLLGRRLEGLPSGSQVCDTLPPVPVFVVVDNSARGKARPDRRRSGGLVYVGLALEVRRLSGPPK